MFNELIFFIVATISLWFSRSVTFENNFLGVAYTLIQGFIS